MNTVHEEWRTELVKVESRVKMYFGLEGNPPEGLSVCVWGGGGGTLAFNCSGPLYLLYPPI